MRDWRKLPTEHLEALRASTRNDDLADQISDELDLRQYTEETEGPAHEDTPALDPPWWAYR